MKTIFCYNDFLNRFHSDRKYVFFNVAITIYSGVHTRKQISLLASGGTHFLTIWKEMLEVHFRGNTPSHFQPNFTGREEIFENSAFWKCGSGIFGLLSIDGWKIQVCVLFKKSFRETKHETRIVRTPFCEAY